MKCCAALGALMLVACSTSSTPPRGSALPVSIVATDSGYALPDTLHSGLNHFAFENHGTEIHECMFIKLPDGMSASDYVAQVKSGIAFPEGALDCAGPGLLSPGERMESWVPLDEGNYIIGCWYGDHMTTRRPVGVVVHGAPATPVTPPKEDVTVRMIDFRFELVGEVKSGEQTLRYETVGPSMHEADIVRLEDGRTSADVAAWFKNHQSTPAPGTICGGTMDSHHVGHVTWVRRRFEPGRYVFWCDMPMIQSSEAQDPDAPRVTHADAGMVTEIEVR